MDIVTRVRLILLILASLILIITILYCAIKGKKTPTLRSFILFLILFEVWFLGQTLRIFSPSKQVEWIFVRFEYLGICFIGLVWLIFCLRYTENRWMKKPMLPIALGLIPTASYAAILTNDWHHLFFKATDQAFDTFGSLFYLHTIESYLYITLGAFVLIQYSFYQYEYKRKQIFLLVLAAVLPLTVNVLIVSNVLKIEFDTTPFCLMVSLALYFIATFKYKLLDLVPIARRKIVDTMNEAICVIDRFNKIIDFNHAFTAAFPELALLIEPNFDDLSKVLLERTGMDFKIQQFITGILENPGRALNVEFKVITPRESWLALKMQPIFNQKELLGKIMIMSDISEYQHLVEELHRKNNELITVNQQLREYAATIEELAVVKERNRFARDIHDTLGQTMTLLITLIQFGCVRVP
jgi:signal transduction histidine kinase